MEATLADGELMLSTTLLGEQNTLRLVVMNHRTTEAEVSAVSDGDSEAGDLRMNRQVSGGCQPAD